MKAQCERCKEIVELRFAVGDDGIHVTCPACAAAYFVAASGVVPVESGVAASGVVPVEREGVVERAVEAETSVPEGTPCPKCGHRQVSGASCKKCGLVFARWTPGAVQAGDPEAEALWKQAEASWSDEARHDALLAWVQRSGQFAWLAARYRVARETRGAGDEMTTRSLAKLEKVALTTLALSGSKRSEGDKTPYKKSMVVLVALLLLVGGGLVWAMASRGTRHEEPSRPRVPSRANPPAPGER